MKTVVIYDKNTQAHVATYPVSPQGQNFTQFRT
jgi:hypothetical protein